ncbi:hypothetical protein LOTGIDRAFT_165114 [Lottia gigantea]|uniref:Uncharacterized protein n=1 Tax=Lottia gigantea TaxID=225164 RepID=V3ZYQ7_LOTGI|nr:hypothetical protein LOTGIDRAFT_165114 [Lottia gigantea]ESO89522.1 hypothetical protein LOTGIDRAFT_165114 [Lottia gigantea]
MFFQPIPAKDKITFTNRIDVLTSVDIQEVVKAGGNILRILDGIVYEENFKTPPYREYILILKELRNKYKKKGDVVASNCMKLLASKVKYNIILTSDGVLNEKKTFKGYSNYEIEMDDYVQLASGHDVTNEFDKPWGKSFTDGIVIPNEKQTKKFRSYLNLMKRKAPDDEGKMYPYNSGREMCLDDDYVFDDFDYFTNVSNDDPSE